MITNRSNHIPMFTRILIKKVTTRLRLNLLNQKICGDNTLHPIMIQ